MRKQYHLRRTEGGFDAWDVDRLVDRTSGLPPRDVPLTSILEIDEDYWFAGSGEEPTVRKIAEHARLIGEVDLSFPVILGPDGRVMDGMHRIARVVVEGGTSIRAVQLDVLPEPDFRDCDPATLYGR